MVASLLSSAAMQSRAAIETIHLGAHAHMSGSPSPSHADIDKAWETLERIDLPLGCVCRAFLKLDVALPRCPRGAEVSAWFTKARLLAEDQIDLVASAIWHDAEIKAWPGLEDVLAREVERRLFGMLPVVVFSGGPGAKREVHIRDSVRTKEQPNGRVIACRAFEYGPGGRVAVLDHSGDRISRVTLMRSGWGLYEGWVTAGRRNSGAGGGKIDGDVATSAKSEPTPILQP